MWIIYFEFRWSVQNDFRFSTKMFMKYCGIFLFRWHTLGETWRDIVRTNVKEISNGRENHAGNVDCSPLLLRTFGTRKLFQQRWIFSFLLKMWNMLSANVLRRDTGGQSNCRITEFYGCGWVKEKHTALGYSLFYSHFVKIFINRRAQSSVYRLTTIIS